MTSHDPRDLLHGLSRPKVPAELKQRVLSAAKQVNTGVERRSLEERLWTSAGLRYAWVAAVLFLVAVNVFLGPPPAPWDVAAGRVAQTNWMESLDLESALDDHRSGGPTVAEVHGAYDDYLCDSMVQGDQS
ncbi:MAG: hypothetical protein DRJ61_05600 [Acidobacteria bacterium]|nr:MAG: hypothetical protein DRJ65_09615 [Acidobacteriota bacterium]RLE34236.1 MAG: hypothetical protein DRJ61_05600 [Acidobacteriota bacterium]